MRNRCLSLFLCLWSAALSGVLIGGCGEPPAVITTDDGAEMVYIPAGQFAMGGMASELDERPEIKAFRNYQAERPVHTVRVDGFYIDRHEVTQAQYERFLEEVAQDDAPAVNHPDQPAGLDHKQQYVTTDLTGARQPAVGVNWYDAHAYCRWADKRLPTEAEWEYAARGGDGVYRVYPWGDALPDSGSTWRANYWPEDDRAADGFRYTAPVGSFPAGVSPFGVHDMAGNAEEWVQDWLDFDYYKRPDVADNPQGPTSGRHRVIKGGSQISDRHHIRIGTRLYGEPDVKTPNQGIRCAKDP